MVSCTSPGSEFNCVRFEMTLARRKSTVQAAPSVFCPKAVKIDMLISA